MSFKYFFLCTQGVEAGDGRTRQENLNRLAQHFGAVSGAVEDQAEAEERKRNLRGEEIKRGEA